MKPTKQELQAALDVLSNTLVVADMLPENEYSQNLATIHRAAQYLLSITDDLDEMIEARGKATEGEWEAEQGNSHTGSIATIFGTEPEYTDIWSRGWVDGGVRPEGDVRFITTAANAISRIAGVE